jgi:hypothetical protein
MSIALDLFWRTALLEIPYAVVLSVLRSVASYGCPISLRVSRVTVPVLALTKMAPYSVSAMEETTYFRTLDWHSSGPFERCVHWECVLLPRKKYPPMRDLALGSER